MAHLTDIDNVAPADSLKAGADVLNTWRTRIDALNDILGDVTSVEADQVEKLGTTTISVTQWGYLGVCTAAGGAILDDANASAQRTTLGLAIGTDVLAYDAGLSNLAGIAMAADKFYYTSADNTHVAASVTSFARSILDDANEATFKATVNLEIGTDVQAYSALLTTIAALAVTDSNFIVANGSTWVAESGATARTSLGLGSMATQAHTSVNIDGGTIDGITDLAVVDGGTGSSTAGDARTALGLVIGTNVLAQQTIGIADDNLVEMDDANPATSGDYARFTAAGLVGRDATEVKTDLSLNNVENVAISGWAGSGNITTIGTVTSGTLSTGAVLADVTMTLGSDADGDIYYRASNKLTRLAKGTATHVLTMGAAVPEWAAASGGVDTSGTPVANDYARFTDVDTIEGREVSEVFTDLGLDSALANLTATEIAELEAIGDTTISATQWGYLGAATQGIWVTTAKARAYMSSPPDQLDLTNETYMRVDLDSADYDPGSNLDVGLLGSGTADGTTGDHLIDSGYDFAAAGIAVGMRVKNTTDTTYTYITAVAVGDLTLRDDIFVDTNGWEVLAARFIVPVAGYYLVSGVLRWRSIVADKNYQTAIFKNGALVGWVSIPHSSTINDLMVPGSVILALAQNDYIELWAYHYAGVDTVDVVTGAAASWLTVHFLSEA